jgi:2-oxoglutarate ferredoxin oxidoreductase subunit alpha
MELSFVIAGEAGQGLKTIEILVMKLLHGSGRHVFMSKELMSRVRGGFNISSIRASTEPVDAPRDSLDFLFLLSEGGVGLILKRLGPSSAVITTAADVNERIQSIGSKVFALDARSRLESAGGLSSISAFALGYLARLLTIDLVTAFDALRSSIASKGAEVIERNRAAFHAGAAAFDETPISIELPKGPPLTSALLSGTDAVSIGAISAGCDFIASYPMSPGTGVLSFLARKARKYSIAVEQAEDEIAAITMALGSWYAGGRAMVTTSGGGFALMAEGMSLAGCVESPLVVHLAQRPGPATGLPTRTEQGDLDLALYAGHGEFPRVIYAPGSFDQCRELAARAFETADAFQVPVILLTDQYLLDGAGEAPKVDLAAREFVRHVIESDASYKRYALCPSGISPRAIPGFGKGLVRLDSDEHDEAGRITEDYGVRKAMVEKRLRKLEGLEDAAPELIGDPEAPIMVVGWGSTRGALVEAAKELGRTDIAVIHFSQVWPVPRGTKELLGGARKRIIVEGNATGQFERLLRAETLLGFDASIRSYEGRAFSVENLVERLRRALA